MYYSELYHHGILGQKWGKKNGPPYPLSGGSYSVSEVKEIYKERRNKNSIYSKKHFDKVMKTGTVMSTLSYDKDRTKNADMFYTAYDKTDKHHYAAMFNKKISKPVTDENGNVIGTDKCYKYRIDNKAKSDIKVASEDSGAETFKQLYSKNRDFYNYVTDPKRMQSIFVDSKYKFKGYREAKDVLDKMHEKEGYVPTDKEVATLYRMFNYTIPSDGGGNVRVTKDIKTQRAKFFNELKKSGYGAVLDTNDAIYGGYKANAPVIVFDMSQIVPEKIRMTSTFDKRFSSLAYAGRKLLGK